MTPDLPITNCTSLHVSVQTVTVDIGTYIHTYMHSQAITILHFNDFRSYIAPLQIERRNKS